MRFLSISWVQFLCSGLLVAAQYPPPYGHTYANNPYGYSPSNNPRQNQNPQQQQHQQQHQLQHQLQHQPQLNAGYPGGKSQYPAPYNPDPSRGQAAGSFYPTGYHRQNSYNAVAPQNYTVIPNRPLMGTGQLERPQSKCRIWVPVEAVPKYKWAREIQLDQSKSLQQIEVCCPGYGPLRWQGVTHCRPICENCRNGRCIAPGQCRCHNEFVRNDNGDCVFTCPLGCLNGRCFLDGSCECNAGYKLDERRKFCRPICSTGCGTNPLHNCTEPEVCGCAKGYQLTDEGCQPTCNPPCGIGGMCREPNSCDCMTGYTKKEGVCQSDCYQKCDNGICFSRNRCICNPGFTYHERSTQCIPL